MRRSAPTRRPAAEPPLGPPETVAVAAMGAQGDGVAEDGRFVPLTLPGERVSARFAGPRGELEAVLQASGERVVPPCPHFGACGGCALQHWDYAPYLTWKREQLVRLLARERLETEVAAPVAIPPGARRRLALHARRGPTRDQAVLGFKARRSWSVVPIAVCPISRPALVEALPVLARLAAPFLEHPKSAPTLHVTVTDSGLDVDVTGVEAKGGGLSADARVGAAALAQAADLARLTLAGEILYRARAPLVTLGRVQAELPPGGFLQASAEAEAAMAAEVCAAVAGAARVADLHCGLGAFTFRLAEQASVLAVDGAGEAVRNLLRAVGEAPGLKGVTAEVRDLDRRPLTAPELKRFDAVVFDPPRAGAEAQARQLAASAVPVVAAVSCNPATFVRDARILADGGYRLERVTPVDQFLWSSHIELVAVLRR